MNRIRSFSRIAFVALVTALSVVEVTNFVLAPISLGTFVKAHVAASKLESQITQLRDFKNITSRCEDVIRESHGLFVTCEVRPYLTGGSGRISGRQYWLTVNVFDRRELAEELTGKRYIVSRARMISGVGSELGYGTPEMEVSAYVTAYPNPVLHKSVALTNVHE